MKVKKLVLDNIKCYDTESVTFNTGLTVIHGDNGAGKSTLVNSIFAGLYTGDILKHIDANITLDSLVRKNEDQGSISVEFESDGTEYTVTWVLSIYTDDNNNRKARTKSCTLEYNDQKIEGVKNVRSKIEQITGFDAKTFVNSVFIRQGDITRIVDADSDVRQSVLDELLGFNEIDAYIERMDDVRKEFKYQQRRTIGDKLEDVNQQIDQYPERESLISDIDQIQSQIQAKKTEKQQLTDEKETLQQEINNIENEIQELKEKEKQKQEITEKIDEKEEQKQQLENKIDAIENKISQKKDKKSSLESEKQAMLDDVDVDDINQAIQSITDEIDRIEQEISENQQKLSTIQRDIKHLNSSKDSSENRIEELTETIKQHKSKRESLREKEQRLTTKIKEHEKEIEQQLSDLGLESVSAINEKQDNQIQQIVDIAEVKGYNKLHYELHQEKSCPVCNNGKNIDEIEQTIENNDESINRLIDEQLDLETLKERVNTVDQLQTKRDRVQQDINELIDKIDKKVEKKNTLQNEVNEINQQIDAKTEEETAVQEKIEDLQQDKSSFETRKETYEQIRETTEKIESCEQEITNLNKNKQHNNKLLSEVADEYRELHRELHSLNQTLDNADIENKKTQITENQSRLSEITDTIQDIENTIDEKNQQLSKKQQQKQRVESLYEKRKQLEEKQSKASTLETEAESIIHTYKSVKQSLRETIIKKLNTYTMEIFDTVYKNQVYQSINISKTYDIEIISGDGNTLSPSELSGGERSLLSLSIRIAIYRVLADQNINNTTLPPLFLDEPTPHLDADHVSNLTDLITLLKNWNVPQIIIISHNTNMIQSADHAYTIKKDPSTEASHVHES